MNNGKYQTEQYQRKQAEKVARLFGHVILHDKTCDCCGEEFKWLGRLHTKAFTKARFCSRSCSNNRSEWWKGKATFYRTIAFQHYPKMCVVCGFNKVVAVHHINEDNTDNRPQNLVVLCPNHHEMTHMKKYEEEMQTLIDVFMISFWGYGVNGNTAALHAATESSILSTST